MVRPVLVVLAGAVALVAGHAAAGPHQQPRAQSGARCPSGNAAGLALPPGFCATVFADHLGHTRHLVVDADGTVYANSQKGNEAQDRSPAGLIVMRDVDGDGVADRITRPLAGGLGGTGIALYKQHVFLEDGSRILRYRLADVLALRRVRGDVVLSGLPTHGDHHSHSIVITRDGTLFVNSGSATNACQRDNRQAGSPGQVPCAEKALRAGIWRYRADRLGQVFAPGARYASGIRNAVGLALDPQDHVFATQHGRDQLFENWGTLYTPDQGQNLPAEELLDVQGGDDFGWPECYFDPGRHRLVLAPEYNGDGGRAIGVCARRKAPVAAFPAHWAPNALALYDGPQFPSAYRGGAFIAFHGSWNRAPGPQDGFNVVFQPLTQGRASGPFVVFADGFAGPNKASGDARYRPTGLATGPDGALYISDDKQGRIWKITYRGNADAAIAAAQGPAPESVRVPAPEPTGHPVALPAGVTSAMVAQGRRLYNGEVAGAPCAGCHGARAQGTPVGPRLANRDWLWSKGDLAGIRAVIVSGVPRPKNFAAPMPAFGGVRLDAAQLDALTAYVWSVGHGGAP